MKSIETVSEAGLHAEPPPSSAEDAPKVVKLHPILERSDKKEAPHFCGAFE
jgi:hypothetical protein